MRDLEPIKLIVWERFYVFPNGEPSTYVSFCLGVSSVCTEVMMSPVEDEGWPL